MPERANRRFETIQTHGDEYASEDNRSCTIPIDTSVSFRFHKSEDAVQVFNLSKRGFSYSRFGNPTVEAFEKRILALEGGQHAVAVASGAAAVLMTVLSLAKAGDNIISTRSLYCGTFHQFEVLLPNLGIQTRFLPDDYTSKEFRSLVDDKTKLVFSESIGNPRLTVPDYELLVGEAHRAGLPVAIDATFTAGGFFCRPFDHGVDIIIHSATKWIGGHGTTLGGVVIDSGSFDWERNASRFPQLHATEDGQPGTSLWSRFGSEAFALYLRFNQLRDYGSTLSAQAAQQLLIGMETLSLRCERQALNALEVAEWLNQHSKIAWVSHLGFESHATHERAKRYNKNGLSSVFTFGIKGGAPAALRLIDGLRLIINAANIGDSKSIIGHPWSTTHRQLKPDDRIAGGVTEDLIRLSAGTENVLDIIDDLEQSLDALDAPGSKDSAVGL